MLATTMLSGAGAAHAAGTHDAGAGVADVTQTNAVEQSSQTRSADSAAMVPDIIVTARKRDESLQSVPMSIQALGTAKLTELNIKNFEDYVKFLPSVSFQTTGEGPANSQVFMRSIANGANGNHSGSLPTVGTYLDEMPVTTIGGTLDLHIYDIARVEVLPGPQGTLYGASSEAGTLRIITNKPSTAKFAASVDGEINAVDHGGIGHDIEGFINLPVSSKIAVRLVAWDEEDAGFIDNVPGTRTFSTSHATISNQGFVKKHFNNVQTLGGRAALKWDVNDRWTVEPTVMAQRVRYNGVFGYEPDVGYLKVQHFLPDVAKDKWGTASLVIKGKIGKYDLTYAGGYFQRSIDAQNDYTDYSIFYDRAYGSGSYWVDSAGKPLVDPDMEIFGKDRFTKTSQELRVASPEGDRIRFIAGLFEQRQTHWVDQSYQIPGFSPVYSVPRSPNTVWLTDEFRVDRDAAAFGEVTFDLTPKLSFTGGVRGYYYRNSLKGFYGFSAAYNALTGFGSGMGVNNANCLSMSDYRGVPCINLDKTVSDTGETHKINGTYKFDKDRLVYLTYSTGFRPGGVNRNGNLGPYSADTLSNYEFGWKTSWLNRSVIFNGAAYYENWNKFQYSFLGPNLLTAIENGPKARVFGVEVSANWQATNHFSLAVNGTYNDAKMQGVLCKVNTDPCPAKYIQAPDRQRLPYTPLLKANATARYIFPVQDWNAHVQAAVVYQSREQLGLQTKAAVPMTIRPSASRR